MGEYRHKPMPKQEELMASTVRHTVYSGAVGAGKSRALCFDAVKHVAGKPRSRYGLFRKTRVALIKSTLKTLLEGDGNAPPVLPAGSYSHNKTIGEIRVNGGGSILYGGVETPEAVQSMNLSGAGIDEVTEFTSADYSAVDDRVRLDIGMPLCVKSATNPGPRSHWLAKALGLDTPGGKPAKGFRVILTRTSDNYHLPESYLDSFQRHAGTLYYRRMFLGEWCGSDGLVYDRFNRDVHARTMSGATERVYLGVDEGYSDPFVVLEVMTYPDGHLHVAGECYETRMVETQKIDQVRRMGGDTHDVIVDSAAPALIDSMRRSGLQAIACEKGPDSIAHGINLVQTRLNAGTLTIDPCCVNLIREFESYEWEPRPDGLKDKPRDRDNHALDALRYVVRHVDAGGVPPVLVEMHSTEPEGMWEEW